MRYSYVANLVGISRIVSTFLTIGLDITLKPFLDIYFIVRECTSYENGDFAPAGAMPFGHTQSERHLGFTQAVTHMWALRVTCVELGDASLQCCTTWSELTLLEVSQRPAKVAWLSIYAIIMARSGPSAERLSSSTILQVTS